MSAGPLPRLASGGPVRIVILIQADYKMLLMSSSVAACFKQSVRDLQIEVFVDGVKGSDHFAKMFIARGVQS
eukprot:scaffold115690_cov39-Tisochrysis_lutea.AAC.1